MPIDDRGFISRNELIRRQKLDGGGNPYHDARGLFASADGAAAADPEAMALDHAKFHILKTRWSALNNDLLPIMDKPDSPEYKAKMGEMQQVVKDIYKLRADPGGVEGIGLPGGHRDLVIIGAGPGGVAAATMAGSDKLDVLLIDGGMKVGGQAKESSRVENLMGYPAGVAGKKLSKDWEEQALRMGADLKLQTRVTGITIDPVTEIKTLTLSDGTTVTTRAVILAGGVTFNKMQFPGSDAGGVITADGERLTRECEDKNVVVLGGSNGAAQAALGAAQKAKHVTLLARSELEKGMSQYQIDAVRTHKKITVIEGDEVAAVEKDAAGNTDTVVTRGGKHLDMDMVGIFIGSRPDTAWLPKEIKLSRANPTEAPRVQTNPDFETSMPGVFAVGDIRDGTSPKGLPRIGVALGEGAIAARSAIDYFSRVRPTVAHSTEHHVTN